MATSNSSPLEYSMATSKPHTAILCPIGLGHIIPLLELGKHLVLHCNRRVTFFLLTLKGSQPSATENQILQATMKPDLLDYIRIPVDISGFLPANAPMGMKLFKTNQLASPFLLQTICSMKSKPTMLIADLFGTETFPVADELKMSKYVFNFAHSWLAALNLYTPTLDREVKGEYVDGSEPVKVPGCKSVQPVDLFSAMLDRNHEYYQAYLSLCNRTNMADGILVNTWPELEAATLEAINEGKLGGVSKVPVYAVGPLMRQPTEEEKRASSNSYVFEWLDKQSEESVIYVAFGSGGSLSEEQMTELAFGLEQSGHKFVWLVRPPTKQTANENYFSGGKVSYNAKDQETNYLPDGFLSRTRTQAMGLVLTDWAPQFLILRHPSVGGSFSHCGWNSVLESISSGVPIVAWPLFAEQSMNATLLEEEIGIAIRAKRGLGNNLIPREEIARAIKKIMDKEDKQGCAIRARVKQLKKSMEEAISKVNSSYGPFSWAIKSNH